MAGHNKWSKVKHIKGAVDAKRGKLFSRLSREITIAAREGGGDPALNARLRQAVATARTQNMPGDNITRAIKKGTGEIAGVSYEEITYEGYGPGGVALLVETATDNKNRTAADMRSLFQRHNGNLGTVGSVAYLFERHGEIRVPQDQCDENRMMELSIEAGADDMGLFDGEYVVTTANDQLKDVALSFQDAGITVASQKLVFQPTTVIDIADSAIASQAMRLFEALDDHADTLNVFVNFDISDQVLMELEPS